MTVQGFLFDMDGLLLDTERVGLVAFQSCIAPMPYDARDVHQFYLSLIGGTRSDTIRELTAFLPEGRDAEDFYASWWAEMDRYLNVTVPLRPFAREVLSDLSAQAVPMAVVTSTQGARARQKLKKAGILEYFDVVVAGDEVAQGKPHPEPYLSGARLLGLAPEDCAAFEDSDTGITSAVEAGTKAVQIPDLRPDGQALPDLGQIVAHDLKDGLTQLRALA